MMLKKLIAEPPLNTQKGYFYKFVSVNSYAGIIRQQKLLPLSKIQKGVKGNWAIPAENLSAWLRPNPYYGSPLQALLILPAKNRSSLALLQIQPTEQTRIYRRDIQKLFFEYDLKNYMRSFSATQNYEIEEALLAGEVPLGNIKVVNFLIPPKQLTTTLAEQNTLLDFAFRKGNIFFEEDKINYKRGRLKIMLKRIISF